MNGSNAKKGKVLTENYKSYKGKSREIIYRSSWELTAFGKLDKLYHMGAIKGWASEETVFKYISPKDNEEHRYFMDLTIMTPDDNIVFVEIKPYQQTQPPDSRKIKKPSAFKAALETYQVNRAKWEAVELWCKKNTTPQKNYTFKIWTEHELKV